MKYLVEPQVGLVSQAYACDQPCPTNWQCNTLCGSACPSLNCPVLCTTFR